MHLLSYFGHLPWLLFLRLLQPIYPIKILPQKSQFPRSVAFGDEVAQTDDSVIVEATRTSASPHSKQINLGLLWGPHTPAYTLALAFENKALAFLLHHPIVQS